MSDPSHDRSNIRSNIRSNTDAEEIPHLVEAFEACTLPGAEWTTAPTFPWRSGTSRTSRSRWPWRQSARGSSATTSREAC